VGNSHRNARVPLCKHSPKRKKPFRQRLLEHPVSRPEDQQGSGQNYDEPLVIEELA
jgi:hypothetical protein